MRTIETKVYEFHELSDSAKEKARDWYREHALDYEWWDSVYDDAKRIGLEITSFDLDRSRHAKGKLVKDAHEVADLLMQEHGDTCDTYKLAESFLKERDEIVNSAEKDENGDLVSEWELDQKLDKHEEEFTRALLEEYSVILQNECDYLLSDECVDDTIRANEYTFTEAGKRYG